MVGRVGEGGPRARVPDRGARYRLAYEVTAGARPPVYGRLRWGGEDGPASQLAVSGRSSRAGLGHAAAEPAETSHGRFPEGGVAVFGKTHK